MRVRVKICGITTPEDAVVAAEAGADAVGLVFYKESPRYVSPQRAREIARVLPPFVDVVGVFVDAPRKEVKEIAKFVGLSALQFHGEEPPGYCTGWNIKVIKAFRTGKGFDPSRLVLYRASGYLLDAYHPELPGGTGQVADWDVALRAKEYGPVILAGGLSPENVAEAVRRVRPFGVDVSSGVEKAPGLKDPEKVR
ncbi:MAG TPA: phosphoribosylanthranilate isomerase, partial [Candidatus Latescibacteria bacterium]|nr:phosphoribosylanthranilate isomerase [Candidatus Latescibacterota bacterium]